MAIFRVEKNKNYTTMSNYHLRDKRLSSRARGLLSQMLSLPDDWDFSVEGLVAMNSESWATIRAILKELEQNGYLIREREQDEKGRFKYSYVVLEKPRAVLPHTDSPHTDNLRQLNTEILNTEILNTDKKRIPTPKKPPTLEEVKAYIIEKKYSVNAEDWYAYYESLGWKSRDGKDVIKNWKNYVVTWNSQEKRWQNNQPQKRLPDYNYYAPKKEEKQFDEDEWRRFAEEVGLDAD